MGIGLKEAVSVRAYHILGTVNEDREHLTLFAAFNCSCWSVLVVNSHVHQLTLIFSD